MTRLRVAAYFLLVFLSGGLTSSIFEWLQPITTIEITNTSGKVIKYLDIEYRGYGTHRGRIAENIAPGQQVIFKWTTEGEAGYQLHATFEDGTELRGGAGYTERGHRVKEALYEDRVTSQVPRWFTFGLLYEPPWNTTNRTTSEEKP